MERFTLPPCRWRSYSTWAGRVGCSSEIVAPGPFGVMRHQCAMCPVADHLDQRLPAERMEAAGEVRHLLFFLYPRGHWQWHTERLRRYMPLFNGERHLVAAVGPETATAGEVAAELAGLDVQLHQVRNNPERKELAGYPLLIEQVSRWRGRKDAHFYGHGKGVVSQEAVGPAALRWADAMYEALLGHWPEVKRQLQAHCTVGIFRRLWKGPGQTQARWHFSGTFRWVRHADFYARNWRAVDPHWLGAETHVGCLFGLAESACLYGEFATTDIGLYADSEWDRWAEPRRREWLEAHAMDRQEPLLVTVIITSARQPELVHEAISSVQLQTTDAWNLVVMDAGELHAAGAFDRYKADARIRVEPTGEAAADRLSKCVQGWAINEAVRRGLVRGGIVCCLSDDDYYAPGWLQAVLTAARSWPDQSAWCGWAQRLEWTGSGPGRHLGRLAPGGVGGPGYSLRGRVDGMQLALRRRAWVDWPEELALASQADGYWMEALAGATPIHPIDAQAGVHRHTQLSTFTRPARGSVRT